MNWVEIGARIRSQREAFGYTRETFAEMLDVTPKFCADIELGKKGMSVPTLCRIASVLKLSTDYACPHADVAVVADLRRRQSAGASGGNLRRLGVIAGLAGAGFLGSNDIAAARPFLLVAGVGNRPFLCAGVVRGILFAIFAAAVLTVRLLTQDVVLPEQLTVSLRVSSHLQTRV